MCLYTEYRVFVGKDKTLGPVKKYVITKKTINGFQINTFSSIQNPVFYIDVLVRNINVYIFPYRKSLLSLFVSRLYTSVTTPVCTGRLDSKNTLGFVRNTPRNRMSLSLCKTLGHCVRPRSLSESNDHDEGGERTGKPQKHGVGRRRGVVRVCIWPPLLLKLSRLAS